MAPLRQPRRGPCPLTVASRPRAVLPQRRPQTTTLNRDGSRSVGVWWGSARGSEIVGLIAVPAVILDDPHRAFGLDLERAEAGVDVGGGVLGDGRGGVELLRVEMHAHGVQHYLDGRDAEV